jgi:hypothetical protein
MKRLADMKATELLQSLADVPDLWLLAMIEAIETELAIRKVDECTRAQIAAMRVPVCIH